MRFHDDVVEAGIPESRIKVMDKMAGFNDKSIVWEDNNIHVNKNEALGEYNFNTSKIESFLGLTLSNSSFWRNGIMQNGRFQENSLGNSEFNKSKPLIDAPFSEI